jgi:hypothetical protein
VSWAYHTMLIVSGTFLFPSSLSGMWWCLHRM